MKKKFQTSFYNKYKQLNPSPDRTSKPHARQMSPYRTRRLDFTSSKEELPKSPTNKPDFSPFSKKQTQLHFLRKKQFQAQHPTARHEAQKVTPPIKKNQSMGHMKIQGLFLKDKPHPPSPSQPSHINSSLTQPTNPLLPLKIGSNFNSKRYQKFF